MKLGEYLDVKKLRQYIDTGLVTERFHDTLPLAIYCYGRKAVFSNHWDDVTTKTRGLIVDVNTNEIIARPYEKFFSVEQLPTSTDLKAIDKEFGPPVITEKVNGCLGTFWRYGIHWGIASKGSFHSPHAEFATKWMEKHIEEYGALVFPEGYTPVFEIICQEVQPHVIKYEKDGLVLLNFVKLDTGEELARYDTTIYAAKNSLDFCGIPTYESLEEVLAHDSELFEGYVATYNRPGRTPFKLKIKFPTFLKNRKAFYEEQKKAEPKNEELYKEVHNIAADLLTAALKTCTTRREFADFFRESAPEYSPVCFAMMDERDYKRIIWRIVDKRQRERSTQTSAT